MADEEGVKGKYGQIINNPAEAHINIPEGHMAILYSKFGTEGIFDEPIILEAYVTHLWKLAAYRGEQLSVDVQVINPTP
jgi:hypothetical protein